MKSYLPFISLRIRQSFRWIRSLGIGYGLALISAFSFGIYYLLELAKTSWGAEVIFGISFLIIISIQLTRKDIKFLSLFSNQPKLVLVMDYLLICLVPILVMLISGDLILVAILLASLFPVSSIGFNRFETFSQPKLIFLSFLPFEWQSGIRTNFLLTLIVFLLGVASLFLPYGVLIFEFAFLLFLAGNYQDCESRQILESHRLSPGLFLKKRLGSALKAYFGITVPLFALNILIYSEGWIICIAAMFYGGIILAYLLLSKYAYFQVNERSNQSEVTTGIVFLSLFLPFLIPLPLILVFRNYGKAKLTLKPYLNDFN